MKKASVWTDDELALLRQINEQFQGSPSAAYAAHPDWKAKLGHHKQAALYAKLYNLRGKAAKKAAVAQPQSSDRLVVVPENSLQVIECPKCRHSFHVMQQ